MQLNRKFQCGFTFVELIVVMVITGILGGMIAWLLRGPVQGYVDSARRAGMSDIADLAVYRLTRDVRQALPNSVRANTSGSGASTIYYLDFLPVSGGGRYRAASDVATTNQVACGAAGDDLVFSPSDICFEVLGPPVQFQAGDQVVIMSTAGADAYSGNTSATDVRRAYDYVLGATGTPVSAVWMAPASSISSGSAAQDFRIVHEQVRYKCDPTTGNLTRYWWAASGIVVPPAAPPAGAGSALLATNVSACSFSTPQSGLAAIQLTIAEQGEGAGQEKISLFVTARINTVP